ncbi:MAG: glutathione S-transferase family protein [Mesorhizobium sp.]|nr:glutathione S-transferase family protein [Mesorhizobium sp.]
MYKLYTRPGSGGFVVEAALKIAGVPFDLVDVKKTPDPAPEFLAVSPMNQVPVLVLPDGHAVAESAAICTLLAELHPGAGLGPVAGQAGRADFLRWLAFMTSTLYPADLRYYYAHRSVKQAAVTEMDREIGILDRALGARGWLAGDARSIADVYMLMLVCWHPDVQKARTAWPNVERVSAVLRADPLLAELNLRHEMWAD